MSEQQVKIQEIFSKNRAEEIGYDVWSHFVIPPFYDQLDFKTAKKALIILGGRGCGKTMLLRYLSHYSVFSMDRINITADDITNIGLYWRADTQFCNAMNKRDIPDDIWASAFNNLTAIMLGMELIESLNSIAKSNFKDFNITDIPKINFSRLKNFEKNLPSTCSELLVDLENRLWEFEAWVNDVRKKEQPSFLPGREFILAMIKIICSQVPSLKNASFAVYIDEYENLSLYQKKIILSWLKHGEQPLLYHLAMKRNAFDTRETVGNESLSDIHDFRHHDLEKLILANNYPLFAAEIMLLQLSIFSLIDVPFDVNILRDHLKIGYRKDKKYEVKVLSAAQNIFPDISQKDQAFAVLKDKVLTENLKSRIKKALNYRNSNIDPIRFISKEFPEASIIVPALIYRKRIKPEKILLEMENLSERKSNRFFGQTNWIQNNFVGCFLQLYGPYSRACPFYAGFKTFCKLSSGNIRHFLELCRMSLYRAFTDNGSIAIPIDQVMQAEAARQASAIFFGEISSFGTLGNILQNFILRLGTLFQLAHTRQTQSESEQSHFSIRKGTEIFSADDEFFLKEAEKWSVLFVEHIDTKKKDAFKPASDEYILNPIYAPHFHISYRKKRKLELSTNDVICLIRGNLDEFTALMKRFKEKWAEDPDAVIPTLFPFDELEQNDENQLAGS